ncbi:hypothetical protein FOCG_07628 [Fusarium oxysporum f. sp. radicis-lycopersici 26381]|nr:hypothetical protein FOWG_11820 [Fusarium oxysporum f. sp. lycopersici MN25]EXL51807.1 hypothetical protein FOCG_07628 [Fusarium oxysporum f. sp. radicis-lycopersici 26381]
MARKVKEVKEQGKINKGQIVELRVPSSKVKLS